ncbi:MAG: hypothetical protein KKD39_00090, partial [Candidatus Altiarchaeota archaeon]|nr:hypothetical protein [Candidatus Altiarchaeota archaeon]
ADTLLQHTLKELSSQGCDYAVAYSRTAELHKHAATAEEASMILPEYIKRRRDDGLHPDWSIRFHQKAGGMMICGVPNADPHDLESMGHGAFFIYDMKKMQT